MTKPCHDMSAQTSEDIYSPDDFERKKKCNAHPKVAIMLCVHCDDTEAQIHLGRACLLNDTQTQFTSNYTQLV